MLKHIPIIIASLTFLIAIGGNLITYGKTTAVMEERAKNVEKEVDSLKDRVKDVEDEVEDTDKKVEVNASKQDNIKEDVRDIKVQSKQILDLILEMKQAK